MTCLLVVHDSGVRETLAGVLKKRGFQVAQARDQEEALSLLSSPLSAELVLIGAVPSDPVQFLHEVRRTKPQIPIILASDFFESELMMPAINRGPDDSSRFVFSRNGRATRIDDLARVIRIASGRRRQAAA